MRRPWTNREIAILTVAAKRHRRWCDVAKQLPWRSQRAIEQRAIRLGLRKQRLHTGPTAHQVQVIRQMHTEGYSDADIADRLGRCRERVSAWRRKLGLPNNRNSERHRQKIREALRVQLENEACESLAEIQQIHRRVQAFRRGWPEDCTPIMVQILEFVESQGETTRRAFCEAHGRRYHWKACKTTGGKSAFHALVVMGHLVHCGRRGTARLFRLSSELEAKRKTRRRAA